MTSTLYAATSISDGLPPYAARLSAMHAALGNELAHIVSQVPLRQGDSVLDVGSGDGFFAALFADAGAAVTALDNSEAYLEYARERRVGKRVYFIHGDAMSLPLPDNSMDIVWSGHSMQSYPNLRQCIREFRRVLRPGGTLAVLETDNVHSVMLPWPPGLELSVRQAERRAVGSRDAFVGTYFPRFATKLLTKCSFRKITETHYLIDRHGWPNVDLTEYVRLYLRDLSRKVHRCLEEDTLRRFRQLFDPESTAFLPRRKHFYFRSLETLVLAER